MINKNWNDINYISVIIIITLAFTGSILNVKKYCKLHKTECQKWDNTKKTFYIIFHIFFDALSIGLFALIVYIGLVGYGFNELLAVGIAGFLAKEGNDAIYHFKLIVADKLNSESLKKELQKEKDIK